MSACWARTRAPVPFVEVSPVAGLTLTRAMEVKGTSSVGVRAEAGAMEIWSAAAKLDRKVVPKVASAGHPTLRRIVGPASGRVVVLAFCPVEEAVGEAEGEAEGVAEGDAEGLAGPELCEDVGATQPAARGVPGKALMDSEARPQKPVLPDRARAPRSASASGRAMTSEAVDMKEDTKASDWRSRER